MNSRRFIRSSGSHILEGGAACFACVALTCRPSAAQSTGSYQPAGTGEPPRPERGLERSSREESWSLAVQPRVPDILRVSVAGIFDLKLRFDNVGGTAAEQRFRVQLSIGVQLVVGTLERFKPVLMRPLGPIAMREGHVRKRDGNCDRQYDRANHARASFGTVGQAQYRVDRTSACGGSVLDARRHGAFSLPLGPASSGMATRERRMVRGP